MSRGFLTKKWRTLYCQSRVNDRLGQWLENAADDDITTHTDDIDDETEYTISMHDGRYKPTSSKEELYTDAISECLPPTRFMAGLIRTIWDTMTELWHNHIQHIHDSATQIAQYADIKAVQDQIRALHAMQHQTLAAHQHTYFHHDLDQYLAQTPLLQMQNYLHRYRPVILHSIKQATALATTALKLTSFPGFAHVRSSRTQIHHVREEPIHRKHTKIRNRQITEYFKPTNSILPSNSSNSSTTFPD